MKARLLTSVLAIAALALNTACQKKMAAIKPPPPPRTEAAVAPTAPARHAVTPAATPTVAASTTNRMPNAATKAQIQDLLNRIQDAYFDFDRHDIRPDAQAALAADAKTLGEILKQYPTYKLTIQGNCDERGSDEFNLALGDARAKEAKDYLASLGVPASQLDTVSFGKEHPVCTEHDESCWQKNRRAHITQEQKS
jgi:peptidoglycan-associated lipoprotein